MADIREYLDALKRDAATTGGSLKAGYDRYAADFGDLTANAAETLRLASPQWVARTRESAANLRRGADQSVGPTPMDQGLSYLTQGALSAPAAIAGTQAMSATTIPKYLWRAGVAAKPYIQDLRDYAQEKMRGGK